MIAGCCALHGILHKPRLMSRKDELRMDADCTRHLSETSAMMAAGIRVVPGAVRSMCW